uniref:Uncharacterized protein n=1 Tax=Nomascus leucogenys TaxID=61853 RepID=G1S999_NOMLE
MGSTPEDMDPTLQDSWEDQTDKMMIQQNLKDDWDLARGVGLGLRHADHSACDSYKELFGSKRRQC